MLEKTQLSEYIEQLQSIVSAMKDSCKPEPVTEAVESDESVPPDIPTDETTEVLEAITDTPTEESEENQEGTEVGTEDTKPENPPKKRYPTRSVKQIESYKHNFSRRWKHKREECPTVVEEEQVHSVYENIF